MFVLLYAPKLFLYVNASVCVRVLVCQCKYVCSSGVVWLIRKTCISYANSARRQPTIDDAAASQRVSGALESSCVQAVQLVQSVQAQTRLLSQLSGQCQFGNARNRTCVFVCGGMVGQHRAQA